MEAPVRRSIILARLLLKIGRYRILRVFSLIIIVNRAGLFFLFFILFIRSLFPLAICFSQSDLKSFIAYSSISHICLATLGLFVFNFYRFLRSLIVFLRHRLISPFIFFIRNLLYERYGTRIVLRIRRLEYRVKSLFFFFFN